jgi:hypothetical protein
MNDSDDSTVDFRPGPDYFEDPGPAFGEGVVCLEVAGLRFDLEGLDGELEALLRRRYSGFLGEPGGSGTVRVSVCRAPVEGFLRWRPGRDPTHRLETAVDGAMLFVRSYGFAARFDPAARTGVLSLAHEPEDRRETSFENYLRVVTSWLALEEGGFLFHSSALVRDGEAYLFFGPSGAGKTTCCKLSEGLARAVNDDLVLLRKGEAGDWKVAAVPFTGTFGREETGATYPMAGLYRLVQDRSTAVERLSTAAAVVEVLSSVPFMEERPTDGALADQVEQLVRAVPVRRLRFRKDPGFWDAVLEDRRRKEE